MVLGVVIGHATSTIKHEALEGWRLYVVQPLNAARQPEGDPQIAASGINAGVGQTVVLNTDGKAARDLIGQGEVEYKGQRMPAIDALRDARVYPTELTYRIEYADDVWVESGDRLAGRNRNVRPVF